MKKTITTLLAIILAVGFLSLDIATAGKGNERKGKYFFRKNCRACHVQDGKAEVLNPDSKTMAQWKRIFAKEKYVKFDCKDEFAKQSKEEINDIYAYLYNHAYDSPSPAKCK